MSKRSFSLLSKCHRFLGSPDFGFKYHSNCCIYVLLLWFSISTMLYSTFHTFAISPSLCCQQKNKSRNKSLEFYFFKRASMISSFSKSPTMEILAALAISLSSFPLLAAKESLVSLLKSTCFIRQLCLNKNTLQHLKQSLSH